MGKSGFLFFFSPVVLLGSGEEVGVVVDEEETAAEARATA